MLNKQLVLETAELIKDYIHHPPLDKSIYLSKEKRQVYLINDGLQYTKSFKLRGAFSKLLRLTEDEKAQGVVAISSGNHGIAVSYACQLLNIKNVLIFVPKNTPKSKTEKIEHFGAKLVIQGENYDEAHSLGMAYVKQHKMTLIDAYNKDPFVYAGQGTLGLEILKQNMSIDTILVPIGGGGLITGVSVIAKALKPTIKIIGVQTISCPAMKASMTDQFFYDQFPSEPSVCEALIGGIGALAYEMSQDCIDEVLTVQESNIIRATQHMMFNEKIISEPSGAVTVAALLEYPNYDFGNVAVILSGSNIKRELMVEIINTKI